jgi:hypothetical protein
LLVTHNLQQAIPGPFRGRLYAAEALQKQENYVASRHAFIGRLLLRRAPRKLLQENDLWRRRAA